ncbi:MAG: hypothetical protein ORN54_00160 [Cyclobacteriaceae bacterium]|nr:hypothetical protein [Cyclobacteriaceae bacterium]
MKFELEFFDEFIRKECRKNKKLAPSSIIPDFSKKCSLIEQEVERIKKSFTNHLFQIENESRIELFIQHHQAHIIRLANKVATAIDKDGSMNLKDITPGHTKLNLCKVMLGSFEDLLNYIETHFSKYFDQDQQIPATYAIISIKEFRDKLEIAYKVFAEKGVGKELTDTVLFPVHQFVNVPEKQQVTFRRLIYMKYLLKELHKLKDNPSFSESVFEHLFYLNFNSFYFLQLATTKIRNEVEGLHSIISQLEHLSLALKKLNQAQVKPSFALKPNRDSLKDLLSNWLEEEIHFIEKRRQLTLMIPLGDMKIENETEKEFKVKTILSVPQLAYSIRLLKDSGIITNENKSELIRFFSKNFSSAHSDNISSGNFKKDYFSYEKAAVTHVQGVLNRLLLHSKKEG